MGFIFTNIQDLQKAYTEGIYSDTPANRKLGRVGMTYAEYSAKKGVKGEDKNDSKEKEFSSSSIEDIPFEEAQTRFGGYKYHEFEDGDRIEIHWNNRDKENKEYWIYSDSVKGAESGKSVSKEDLIKFYNDKTKNKEGKNINKLPWVRTKPSLYTIQDKIIKGNYAIIREANSSESNPGRISIEPPYIVEVDKQGNILYSGPNGVPQEGNTFYPPKNIQRHLSDRQVLDFLNGKSTFEEIKEEGGKAYYSRINGESYTNMDLSNEEKTYLRSYHPKGGLKRRISRGRRR